MNQQQITLLLDFNIPFDAVKVQLLDSVVAAIYSNNKQIVS